MTLVIGVDVGGTNTDSVLLDLEDGVLAWHKAPTTADTSVGIINSIRALFDDDAAKHVKPEDIANVTIGTTHFINAVIERDIDRLVPVAVLRLCGPYSVNTPPFTDFPPSLAEIMNGHYAFLNGGFKVDGSLVKPIDKGQILEQCEIIKAKNIKSIVVIGNFSPMDNSQEITVRDMILEQFSESPDVSVIMSHEVANIGFLERENASILNASILPFAKKLVASFEAAVRALGIVAPVLLTQNDGTVLPAKLAAKIPIRSFSSGATNSMRGAAYLCSKNSDLKNKNVVVMDIGGTTTDVGMLQANGFPRQAPTYSNVGGVRMNFPVPHVESVGFGGGSIVRKDEHGSLTIGPDSVGSNILSKALLFGGDTATATDVKLAASLVENDGNNSSSSLFEECSIDVSKASALQGKLDKSMIDKFGVKTQEILSAALDRIKTSPDPIPVLLVGGGSILAPSQLDGASEVIRPQYFGIANAIGAAIAKISAQIDTIGETSSTITIEDLKNELCAKVIEAAITNGAKKGTVDIAEVNIIPLPYVKNRVRISIKAVGDMDAANMSAINRTLDANYDNDGIAITTGGEVQKHAAKQSRDTSKIETGTSIMDSIDVETYKPHINEQCEWIISEVDLEFLVLGAYILGAGGGGSPYGMFLRMRNIVRQGTTIKIVDIKELVEKNRAAGIDGQVITVSGAGSPTVGVEQLSGKELEDAYDTFIKHYARDRPPQAVMSIEIGGSNGIQGMVLSASHGLIGVDADLMGRAYPTLWQTTPTLFNEGAVLAPSVISDGNGNNAIFLRANNMLNLEKMRRASLSQIGSRVGTINGMVRLEDMVNWCIPNTTSLAWRIGRAVMLARQKKAIDTIPDVIIDQVGGKANGKEIFRGKIVGVDRRLEGGYSVGDVVLQSLTQFTKSGAPYKLRIPFKNENISALLEDPDTGETSVLATVPDLICVIDTQDGSNIGNPEFKYGLTAFVLVLPCSDKWSGTPEGIALGGPAAFNVNLEYKPIGRYVEARSVIDEFAPVV